MKKQPLLIFLIGCLIVISSTSCKKDNNTGGQTELDTLNPALAVDSGTIGLVVDVRPIAKKGYSPLKVSVEFEGNYAGYSSDINVNSGTNTAILRIDNNNLDNAIREDFAKGVTVSIVVMNSSDEELANEMITNQPVDASNTPLSIDTELPYISPAPVLNPNATYLIQAETSGNVVTTYPVIVTGFPPYPRGVGTAEYISEGDVYQEFNFHPVPDGDTNEYYLTSTGGAALGNYPMQQSTLFAGTDEITDNHIMIVEPDEGGWVKLKNKSGNYYKEVDDGMGYSNSINFVEGTASDFTRFRLISADITWSIINRGTSFDQPILPPAQLEFAYNATLRNCSPAILTETVGRSESRSTTFTTGLEESVELFTSHEASVEVTAGVEVEASFFGSGASYNFEVTAGYSYTTSETNTTTNTWEESETNEVEISRERSLELSPQSAVKVYDAVQIIKNVTVPFTKVLRLQGIDGDGEPLKGNEIRFQLFTNRFGGVVTEIGDDYVDFTVRGSTIIDQMMEVETNVDEIEGACD
ncbi:MAG: hypothetical protein GVY19_01300 [Bacteroidetes bacterium]|jgi:hypothetical protein|nr:hypothetical protein [Bacteroidota bacterium]